MRKIIPTPLQPSIYRVKLSGTVLTESRSPTHCSKQRRRLRARDSLVGAALPTLARYPTATELLDIDGFLEEMANRDRDRNSECKHNTDEEQNEVTEDSVT